MLLSRVRACSAALHAPRLLHPTLLCSANVSWVEGTTLVIDRIPTAPGNVTLESEFDVMVGPTHRRLRGNGVPNHR